MTKEVRVSAIPPQRQAPVRPSTPAPGYALNATPPGRPSGSLPVQRAGTTERILNAPTLAQFWRSDVRHTTSGRKPRWAGMLAFWLGLAAAALLVVGSVAGSALVAAFALPLSAVAGFFALIAIIAGVGRALGFLGLLLALAGNVIVVDAVIRLFS